MARLEHSVQGVRWRSGATSAEADGECPEGAPIPNATILDDDDRAASAQLYWMMVTICKGAAPNTVFLAGDSEGLEASRQLTEVRTEDEDAFCRTTDVHLVLLIPR